MQSLSSVPAAPAAFIMNLSSEFGETVIFVPSALPLIIQKETPTATAGKVTAISLVHTIGTPEEVVVNTWSFVTAW